MFFNPVGEKGGGGKFFRISPPRLIQIEQKHFYTRNANYPMFFFAEKFWPIGQNFCSLNPQTVILNSLKKAQIPLLTIKIAIFQNFLAELGYLHGFKLSQSFLCNLSEVFFCRNILADRLKFLHI
jgi:hypothetical protein